jgi:CRP-like cAMP-binding protein
MPERVSVDLARRNRVLASLPPDELERLLGGLELHRWDEREMLYDRDAPIESVVFPLDAVFSLLSDVQTPPVEVATVGNDGMVGLPLFLQAARTSSHMVFCQVPGRALRMPAGEFADAVANGGELHTSLHRYTQALFTHIAQNAACNAVHNVGQRAARWILLTHDRVGRDEFELTQEFLAQMLGVQRTAVNAAAQGLQEHGVRYTRGRVTVVDRDALHGVACDCYDVVYGELDRLLPPPA